MTTAIIYTVHSMFGNVDVRTRSVNSTHWISFETPWDAADGKPQMEIMFHFDDVHQRQLFMLKVIEEFTKSLNPIQVVEQESIGSPTRPIPPAPPMDDEIPF